MSKPTKRDVAAAIREVMPGAIYEEWPFSCDQELCTIYRADVRWLSANITVDGKNITETRAKVLAFCEALKGVRHDPK